MSNLILKKMHFNRKNNDVNKFIKSTPNGSEHTVQCTVDYCRAKQDFEGMNLKEAREKIHDAGWRKGIDEDKVEHCCCPECFEEMERENENNKELSGEYYD